MDPRPWTGQLLAAKAAWVHLFNTYNAAVQPRAREAGPSAGTACWASWPGEENKGGDNEDYQQENLHPPRHLGQPLSWRTGRLLLEHLSHRLLHHWIFHDAQRPRSPAPSERSERGNPEPAGRGASEWNALLGLRPFICPSPRLIFSYVRLFQLQRTRPRVVCECQRPETFQN